MKQKITRVGNSAAVIIPKMVLKEQGLKIGSMVNVTIEKPKKATANTVIDKEVYAVATDLLKRYLPAFKTLAREGHEISHP